MACKKKCDTNTLSEKQFKIVTALAAHTAPATCKELAAAIDIESKVVSCQLRSLKNKGYIESPARCRYTVTEAGRRML